MFNRLKAMTSGATLRVVQPLPYLPIAKPLPPWGREASRDLDGLEIRHAPMLYAPGVLKTADGLWLGRSIYPIIARLHKATPVDLIDAHFGYPEGVGCMQVARRLGVPLFITIRGFENEYIHKTGIAAQMLSAMRGAAGCISVSHSLQKLAAEHGVAPERIRVIHNAIDSGTFKWGDPKAARATLRIAPDVPLIVSVGHLVSRKRHHVLIEAFAQLRRRHPRARLVIIGAPAFERTYPDELKALARARSLEADILFSGNIPPPQVALWLQAADVFALGTAREGCCNAVLEALAAGAPVVTTPVGDNAHFVLDGDNGHIAPVGDVAAFAQAIERALTTEWDRQSIAKRLLDQAGSWGAVGTRVLEFMRERLGAGANQRATA